MSAFLRELLRVVHPDRLLNAEAANGAGLVLDEHRAADTILQPIGQDARNSVNLATGGEANDDMWFHTVNAGVMRSYIATRSCIGFDCNRNGVEDSVDISSGTSPDVNGDGIPDFQLVVDNVSALSSSDFWL